MNRMPNQKHGNQTRNQNKPKHMSSEQRATSNANIHNLLDKYANKRIHQTQQMNILIGANAHSIFKRCNQI